MVFAKSCQESEKLGTGIVVPTRAACSEPDHLFEEAKNLWAAEQNREDVENSICSSWGRVCILPNPDTEIPEPFLREWATKVNEASTYTALLSANGEGPVLNASKGQALLDWPTDCETSQPLSGFDLLLMTATQPSLQEQQYPTIKEIADAWRNDKKGNVLYFYNNRHFGIYTFEDEQIKAFLQSGPPNTPLRPPT